MKKNILSNPKIGLVIALIILTVIFIPVFFTNYVYLDEAYQLWNNQDNTNYNNIFSQGRWLLAILANSVFASISTISDLKIIRIISFISWAFFLEEFFRLGKKWQQLIEFNSILLTISGIYIVCSISVAIYIGWGSCAEAGLAILFALWSGHLFFNEIVQYTHWNAVSKMAICFGILCGLCSLLTYQIAFGTFLIPFVIYLIHKKSFAKFKIILFGVISYLTITLIYYLIFLLSLKISGVPASNRTNFSFDILGKLGFFFGVPLSHAFSFNFLYNTHSILSQAFPILMMSFWVIFLFKNDKNTVSKKMTFLVQFIGFCMLIYLPLLVGKESFSSYRTMFALNFVVAFALLETANHLIQKNVYKTIFEVAIICCFIAIAYRNFRFNFIGPLKKEYYIVNNYFNKKYQQGVDTIYFLRPQQNIFYTLYGINSFNDEFGIASTFKDWTPEPLVKQLIFEKTKNREIAEKVNVIQFTEKKDFEAMIKKTNGNVILFDIPFILESYK